MNENIKTRELTGGTLEAYVETESFTQEKEESYLANNLSTDRHENSGTRYQSSSNAAPMQARSTTGRPVHDLKSADVINPATKQVNHTA